MPKASENKGTREILRTRMMEALREGDTDGFYSAFNGILEAQAQEIREDYEAARQETDSRVLAARGVRQLTSEERSYYQRLGEAMRASDPKQALTGANLVLPETVVNDVFEDLRTRHPLLGAIDFVNTNGAVKWLMNTNEGESAAWGTLCAEIVKELTAGFAAVDTTLAKLSAFIPVCKAMLELGPEWLDRFVRETLSEALANGLEDGIVAGTGKNMPIGMNRQVGEGTTITDGVYPVKTATAITDLSPVTVGTILAGVATTATGKTRTVSDVLFIVNPVDYFSKVFPATTLQAPDGTYRTDVLPYPMQVIQSAAVPQGKAIMGIARGYFAAVGIGGENGRIDYSDHYQFLEDNRVYLTKAYAYGMPKDNNAFAYLDISGLKPAILKVQTVTEETEETEGNEG